MREMFFEEASELLAGLEKGLGNLEAVALDRARLDQVYRAAHSLKGAAGMVGYPAIAELALAIERVLGQVRSGAASVDPELARSVASKRDELAAVVQAEEAKFRASSA
jgi:two-component system, chemotaxis family, sensor kinase CheA